ncbi:hypothetical protein OXX80_006100 [Metschnikowia pulcherrima]
MIKTLLILWLSGYAIAHVDYEIVADEEMSGFCPDDQGRVLSFALGKFLVIRDKKFVLTNSLKEIGVVKFSSNTESDSLLIHLDGDQNFQLCADYSIGYNSTCHGATDIMFAYEPIL